MLRSVRWLWIKFDENQFINRVLVLIQIRSISAGSSTGRWSRHCQMASCRYSGGGTVTADDVVNEDNMAVWRFGSVFLVSTLCLSDSCVMWRSCGVHRLSLRLLPFLRYVTTWKYNCNATWTIHLNTTGTTFDPGIVVEYRMAFPSTKNR